MCEIFVVSSVKDVYLNDYLKEFISHSNIHCNGWGIAVFENNNAFIEKEPIQASKSHYLINKLNSPLYKKTMLAHIRLATRGNESFNNSHPFSMKDQYKREWTLVHNGTVFDYPKLEQYMNIQKGETDSERILCYFIDEINKLESKYKRDLYPKERFILIESLIEKLSVRSKLNLVFYDGEFIYAHTNYKNTLHYLEVDGGTLFATVPLSNEDWKGLPINQLLVYQDGLVVYYGKKHNHEYIDNEEDQRHLFLDYSTL